MCNKARANGFYFTGEISFCLNNPLEDEPIDMSSLNKTSVTREGSRR